MARTDMRYGLLVVLAGGIAGAVTSPISEALKRRGFDQDGLQLLVAFAVSLAFIAAATAFGRWWGWLPRRERPTYDSRGDAPAER